MHLKKQSQESSQCQTPGGKVIIVHMQGKSSSLR